MELDFERLIEFDLIEKFEEELFKGNQIVNNIETMNEFITSLHQIRSVDQFIKDSPSFPGSTDKIIRNEMVSAIGATLAIEGTQLGNDEIEESFHKADLNESLERKQQEAENSRRVYQFIIDLVRGTESKFIYSEAIIKQIHKYFTENMNYLGNKPGDYRGDFPATFGVPRREGLCKTRSDVTVAMAQFVKGLNRDSGGILSNNIIVKAIMSHYYLTEIHPFADGNGRTARALEALVLYVNGINDYCFWSLANFWSLHRDEYIIHLGNIRNKCSALDFVIWGMKGYLEEIKRIKALVLKKVKQLMLMDYTKYLFETKREQKVKINQRIINVLRLLIRAGKIPLRKFQSMPEIQALYKNVSPPTKSRDFKKMSKGELIKIQEENGEWFIEPNYQILDSLRYGI